MRDYPFRLRVFNGFGTRERIIRAYSYPHACQRAGTDGFPPGFIWSIEPMKEGEAL